MRSYSQEKKFYIYQYLRKNPSNFGDIDSPYYVGKGCGTRISSKHYFRIPSDPARREIIASNMNEADAFQLEILLIHQYGRIDIGTGCLRNRTDGGDGTTGGILSEATKRKISDANKGKKHSEKAKGKMKQSALLRKAPSETTRKKLREINLGKRHSIATKQKIREIRKGKKLTEETKRKISAHNGKTNAKVTPAQVLEIRRIYSEGDLSQEKIGNLFGISKSTTNQIITRRWWKDI